MAHWPAMTVESIAAYGRWGDRVDVCSPVMVRRAPDWTAQTPFGGPSQAVPEDLLQGLSTTVQDWDSGDLSTSGDRLAIRPSPKSDPG